jgi:hypothetical protein
MHHGVKKTLLGAGMVLSILLTLIGLALTLTQILYGSLARGVFVVLCMVGTYTGMLWLALYERRKTRRRVAQDYMH